MMIQKWNLLSISLMAAVLVPAASAHQAPGSGVLKEALMALQMSSHATLRDVQRAEGFEDLTRKIESNKITMQHEDVLGLEIHGITKSFWDPPSMLMTMLARDRDFQIGAMLAKVSPELREDYILDIANTIGDLSATNEQIASLYFEVAAWTEERNIDEFVQQSEMTEAEIEWSKTTNLGKFASEIPNEFLVGDTRTFWFLRELLLNRPMAGEPHAIEIAEKLLETLGEDSRLFRSGLLSVFAQGIALRPPHLKDAKYAKLIETAERIVRKLRVPLWQVTCSSLLDGKPAYLN